MMLMMISICHDIKRNTLLPSGPVRDDRVLGQRWGGADEADGGTLGGQGREPVGLHSEPVSRTTRGEQRPQCVTPPVYQSRRRGGIGPAPPATCGAHWASDTNGETDVSFLILSEQMIFFLLHKVEPPETEQFNPKKPEAKNLFEEKLLLKSLQKHYFPNYLDKLKKCGHIGRLWNI